MYLPQEPFKIQGRLQQAAAVPTEQLPICQEYLYIITQQPAQLFNMLLPEGIRLRGKQHHPAPGLPYLFRRHLRVPFLPRKSILQPAAPEHIVYESISANRYVGFFPNQVTAERFEV